MDKYSIVDISAQAWSFQNSPKDKKMKTKSIHLNIQKGLIK